jgi:hypothetical protein
MSNHLERLWNHRKNLFVNNKEGSIKRRLGPFPRRSIWLNHNMQSRHLLSHIVLHFFIVVILFLLFFAIAHGEWKELQTRVVKRMFKTRLTLWNQVYHKR